MQQNPIYLIIKTMDWTQIIIITLLIFVCFWSVIGYLFYLFAWRKRGHHIDPQTYSKAVPNDHYSFATFVAVPVNAEDPQIAMQPQIWQQRMAEVGRVLTRNHIQDVLFTHGTFIGHDPLELIHLYENLFPKAANGTTATLRTLTKTKSDIFLGDMGNFVDSYITLFSDATQVRADRFRWSSANHHLARLKGCFELIDVLITKTQDYKQEDSIMLVGHSHAGQVFALLTQMLAPSEDVKSLKSIAHAAGIDIRNCEEKLDHLRRHFIDIVTLGTPPRYGWFLNENIRLIHLINHRGHDPIGGSLSGLLTTRDGDYIQQWGIAGSDMLAPVENDRAFNRHLDRFLGMGMDFNYWRQHITTRRRLHDHGHSILIDYDDGSMIKPNCFATGFGHGNYTRYATMLFNFETLIPHLDTST